MIRHQAFFEFLAGSDQTSLDWNPLVAGLATLRLIDAKLDDAAIEPDWASIESVKTAVRAIGEGDPIRGILTTLIDETTKPQPNRELIGRAMLAYGRALNFESKLALACDVFDSADFLAGAPANSKISIEANIRVGSAARRMLDWEKSEYAYSRAAHIADAVGDKEGLLLVDAHRAATLSVRGNLPAAESAITETIGQARTSNFVNALGVALHTRSSIAFQRGQYADAVRFGYEGLEVMNDSADRDGLISDVAAAFGALGMNNAARDGYLIVSATAQSQWVKHRAMLNLMELAAIEENEEEFDRRASELETMPLDRRQVCIFHLFRGQGLQRFGKTAEAEESISKAISIAEANQLHKLAHEATVAMVELKSQAKSRRAAVAQHSDVDPSLRWIESELSSMRESVMSAT